MFVSQFSINTPHRTRIGGAPAGHDARVLAELALRANGTPLVHIALDDLRAAFLMEAVAFFAPHIEVLSFPAWDCLPYDRTSPHADISGQRMATLARLLVPTNKPRIVLTTVNALTQKIIPPEIVKDTCLSLAVGDELPIEKLARHLSARGYHMAGTVREVGEFAVRGGIVDLFPTGFDTPLRLDFFGDEVESLRTFDPLSQITTGKIDRLLLQPTSEILLNDESITHFRSGYRELFGVATDSDPLYEAVSTAQKFPGTEHWLPLFYTRLVSLLDYVPGSVLTLAPQTDEAIAARVQQINDFYQARLGLYEAARRGKDRKVVAYKPVPVASLYYTPEEITSLLEHSAVGLLSPFTEGETSCDAGGIRARDFADARARQDSDLYQTIKDYAAQYQANGKRVMIACYSQGSAERIAGLLRAHDVNVQTDTKLWEQARKLDVKLIPLMVLGLEHGFVAPDLVVISEQDILGDRLIRQTKKRKASAQFQLELGSINIGDFMVHGEHGIGRYEGLETINALGTAHDCIRLIYDGGDKLFVPVENIDVLSRYASAEAGAVLDKLGGVAWQARKARVKKRLLDIADGLLKIAAERQLRQAEIIEVQEGTYQEFAARFPYNETDDQEQSIQSVLDDLASGKPMDRLVCGDVGFGKTEVALRAAFAVAQAGLQVAVVAPTTLLARQHYQNFTQRFTGFPVRIAQLSRMVTAKDAKETKEAINEGKVDIVVGTHALLSKEIKFQRLGLVIIDEEQHFGVKQKEQLKELRADVHVLTLTATPIPRTLQLALTGVRELSLITTPPVDRLAVSTYVLPYDPMVIREALMREHYRGGQSFYVCPRIEDLASLSADLRELVPDLKLITAHGRMSPTELDDIMTAFDANKFDVLLATNIVESGLDIPNANTIILHRADMFGLAQLYQLRGRVGRSKQRGYAYFTYSAKAPLASTAQQRLEVISTLDQLGAGFQLASHDMDIRGTGNLLGEEQSGHIREVGIELYQQMLEDAVAATKAGMNLSASDQTQASVIEHWTPQINIGLSVLIPETYVTDLNVRLGLYRRLADRAGEEDIESIAAEMVDRFGPLPEEVENLLQTVEVKQLCRKAGVAKLDAGAKGVVIGFYQDQFARPDLLISWIGQQAGTVKVRPDQKIVLMRAWDSLPVRLAGIKKVLQELACFV
ncbi:MAG: transcription-repair coupling factor [Alphaproteobacteria bacterium]|nr:transcription-repair coupling factor [Alphaproteobacteria bacterium]